MAMNWPRNNRQRMVGRRFGYDVDHVYLDLSHVRKPFSPDPITKATVDLRPDPPSPPGIVSIAPTKGRKKLKASNRFSEKGALSGHKNKGSTSRKIRVRTVPTKQEPLIKLVLKTVSSSRKLALKAAREEGSKHSGRKQLSLKSTLSTPQSGVKRITCPTARETGSTSDRILDEMSLVKDLSGRPLKKSAENREPMASSGRPTLPVNSRIDLELLAIGHRISELAAAWDGAITSAQKQKFRDQLDSARRKRSILLTRQSS